MSILRRLLPLVGAVVFLISASAQADNLEDARTLGKQGVEAFNAGEYQKAYKLLMEADQLHHAPTLTLYIARSHAKLNRLVEAKAIYRALIQEATQPNAPQQFVSAKRDATNELSQLAARIPTLTVVVRPANAKGLRILVDGTAQPAESAIELNAGTHDVQVFSDNYPPKARQVRLDEGAAESSLFRLAEASDGPGGDDDDDDDDDDDGGVGDGGDGGDTGSSGGSMVPAAIAFGVGGAGLVVGTITGLVAMSELSDLETQCEAATGNPQMCPASLVSERDSINTTATISTVGFIVGGIGVAAGVVLAIIQPGGDDATSEPVASLELVVRPQWVGVQGRF